MNITKRRALLVKNGIVGIFQAVVNWTWLKLTGNEKVLLKIKERQGKCGGCMFNSQNADWYSGWRKDAHCTICKCNINLKSYHLKGHCAIKDLNEILTSQMPVEWGPINLNDE